MPAPSAPPLGLCEFVWGRTHRPLLHALTMKPSLRRRLLLLLLAVIGAFVAWLQLRRRKRLQANAGGG